MATFSTIINHTALNSCQTFEHQIRELEPGRSVARDGRVRPGDLLLALNYESLWRVSTEHYSLPFKQIHVCAFVLQVTSSQAKSVLRRADLISGEIT